MRIMRSLWPTAVTASTAMVFTVAACGPSSPADGGGDGDATVQDATGDATLDSSLDTGAQEAGNDSGADSSADAASDDACIVCPGVVCEGQVYSVSAPAGMCDGCSDNGWGTCPPGTTCQPGLQYSGFGENPCLGNGDAASGQ